MASSPPNKPSFLPLSMVTASPKKSGMDFSLKPSSSFKENPIQPSKKKSFSGFDKFKKLVSREKPKKTKQTSQNNGMALPTVVVTPTDEPTKSIVQAKSFSNSAENIRSSDDNIAVSSQSSMELLMPVGVKSQRAARSDENLFLKEESMIADDFGGSENVVFKDVLKSNQNKDETRNEEKEEKVQMLLDSGFKTEESKLAENEIRHVAENETLAVGADLNEVQRDHGHLEQSAAMHRKNLRPKNRRPPTVYGRASQEPLETTDQSLCTENVAKSVPHLLDPNIHAKLGNENTRTSLHEVSVGSSKDDLHSSKVSKPTGLLPLKRGKLPISRPEDLQKNIDRRKTIADFKMTDVTSEKSQELLDFLDTREVSQPKRETSLKSNLKENIPLPPKSSFAVDNKDHPFKEKKFPHELLDQRKSKLISEKPSNIVAVSGKVQPESGASQETNQDSLLTKVESGNLNDTKPSGKTIQSSLSINLLDNKNQPKSLGKNEFKLPLNEGVKKLDGNKSELAKTTDKPERPVPPKSFVLKCASNSTYLKNIDDVVDKKLQKFETEKFSSTELLSLKPGVAMKTKSSEKLNVSTVTKSLEPKELPAQSVDVKNQGNKAGMFEHQRPRFSSDDKYEKSNSFKQVSKPNSDDKGGMLLLPDLTSVKPSNMFLNKAESKNTSALQIKELPQEPFKAIRNTKAVPIPVDVSVKDKASNLVVVDGQNNKKMSSPLKPVTSIPKEKVDDTLEDHLKDRNLKPGSASRTCDKDSSGVTAEGNIKTPLVRPASGPNSKVVPNKLNIDLKDSNDWMIKRREKSERSS